MSDRLSELDRDLIDAAVAAGKVRRPEPDQERQVVLKYREARGRMRDPAVTARRAKVHTLFGLLLTVREIAVHLGVPRSTIETDVAALQKAGAIGRRSKPRTTL